MLTYRYALWVIPVFAALALSGQTTPGSAAPPAPASTRLPIQRVVLYKNGIGYFEHLGAVRDRQDVTISFTSGQLNDVLKSLTVLDLNGGRVSGVGYGSQNSVDRQLGELPIAPDAGNSLTEFLSTLRGARIEVRSGTASAITGRLLSVERKTRANGGATLEVDYVALLTDNGELRTTEVSPSFSVRLLERDLARKVGRYLDVVSQEREPDVRLMTISAEGTGERNLFVSYISEVPVWKSTYRLVFGKDPAKAPLLQGWAIVDNTVGQDWENVELSLVAGAPQSFIQNLSRPVYTRRPVVEVTGSALPTPQTYEATLRMGRAKVTGYVADATGALIPDAVVRAYDAAGQQIGETFSTADGSYEFSSLPDGTIRLTGESPGFRTAIFPNLTVSTGSPLRHDIRLDLGTVAEPTQVSASAPAMNALAAEAAARSRRTGSGEALGPAAFVGARGNAIGRGIGTGIGAGIGAGIGGGLIQAMNQSASSTATTGELGDLFEYKLRERLSIGKNQSALVPIVHANIDVEKVSIWNESSGPAKPMRGLWINNSTGLTLDGGTFSVLEEDTFAGEGIFEAIRPGEKRLATYATDLALNVSTRVGTGQQRISRIRILRGVMTHDSEIRETKTYTFRNEDTKPRTVIVEHPVRPGYQLRSARKPDEETDRWQRFRVTLAPKETGALVVEEGRQSPITYSLSNLNKDVVDAFIQQKATTPAIESALRRVLAQQEAVHDITQQKDQFSAERDTIFDDQERLRENLKALRGTPEEKSLTQRYTRQLNEQEDRLQTLDGEIKRLADQESEAERALAALIQEITFDETL